MQLHEAVLTWLQTVLNETATKNMSIYSNVKSSTSLKQSQPPDALQKQRLLILGN